MHQYGLAPAKEPSALFLSTDGETAGGAAVFAAMEGSRPVLAEVQALVAKSAYGTPRRSVVGSPVPSATRTIRPPKSSAT